MNITESCKPIVLVFDIILLHLVTGKQWVIRHTIFVNPEDLELEIMCNSDKEELNFDYVAENSSKLLPVTLHNKNSIDLPVNLSILHVRINCYKQYDCEIPKININFHCCSRMTSRRYSVFTTPLTNLLN